MRNKFIVRPPLLLFFFVLLSFGGAMAQSQLNVTLSSTPVCNFDGTVTATISNGVPPYTYTWYNSVGTNLNVNAPTLTGVPGGFYYLQVQDANQWFGWATITLAHPFNLNMSATNDVCNAGIGTASVSVVSGGTPPFTYLWNTGGTTTTISGLQAGLYEITVTDAAGCTVVSGQDSSLSAIVYDTSPITFNVTTVGSTCTNGSATVANLANGTPPYTFVWNTTPPQYTQTATNLAGSTFAQVFVSDAAGCQSNQYFWINQLPNGLSAVTNTTPETCIQSNGSVSISVSGGTPPYTYIWSNGATTATQTGLSYGWYQVTATDANGCPIIKSMSVARTDPMNLAFSSIAPNCSNTGGSMAVTISGGQAPYTYLWNTGATTSSITGLSAGYYAVSITDANGCYDHIWTYLQIPSSCYGAITGSVLGDGNSNCIYDVADFPFAQRLVDIGGLWDFTDANGTYYKQVLPGNYVVSQVQAPTYFAQTCPVSPASYTVTGIAAQQVVTGLDFFNEATSVVNDLSIAFSAWPARVTTPQRVDLYYQNNGSTMQNAVVTYTHDPLMSLQNGGFNLTSYNLGTRTLTYNVGPVYPGQSGTITCWFTIPTNTAMGTPYTASAEILPIVGDATPVDNQVSQSGTVVASYDPNDKTVSPDGLLAETDSMLNFRVRFQNTGNDTAFTVVIRDTIDADLDFASIQVMGASHSYTLDAESPGVVIFRFDNIMLPDSHINEAASHGEVLYRIKLRDNLPLGTEITNRAAIYFDFNPPIITNTTHNSYGLVSVEPSIGNAQGFSLYPNPANAKVNLLLSETWDGETEIAVRDLSGRVVMRTQMNPADGRTRELNLQSMSKGVYLVECTNKDTRVVRKLVLQ